MKNRTKMIVVLSALLALGFVAVAASSYTGLHERHASAMGEDEFSAMHQTMMEGDFAKAEQYHQGSDVGCPMHDAVTEGNISKEDFQIMYEWMEDGTFPSEKPADLSQAAWELHRQHHS